MPRVQVQVQPVAGDKAVVGSVGGGAQSVNRWSTVDGARSEKRWARKIRALSALAFAAMAGVARWWSMRQNTHKSAS